MLCFLYRPEQLWILNPRKLLRKLEIKKQVHSGGEAEALVSSAKEISIVKSGKSRIQLLITRLSVGYITLFLTN